MIALPGLKQNTPRFFTSASPPCQLGHEPIGPLGASKVWHEQDVIDPHHGCEGDPWKVVALGDQLCAHKDLALTVTEGGENALVGASSSGGIAIHPGDLDARKRFLEGFFNPLGSVAVDGQFRIAGRAVPLKFPPKSTVVA